MRFLTLCVMRFVAHPTDIAPDPLPHVCIPALRMVAMVDEACCGVMGIGRGCGDVTLHVLPSKLLRCEQWLRG